MSWGFREGKNFYRYDLRAVRLRWFEYGTALALQMRRTFEHMLDLNRQVTRPGPTSRAWIGLDLTVNGFS